MLTNRMIDILKDPKTGITDVIYVCYTCNDYPDGKPIIDDPGAIKDSKGNWVCSPCQEENINKMMLRNLGENHPKCQSFIKAEEKAVLRHNNAAKRLNDKAGQHLMSYKRNRYTNTMPLSPGGNK